MIEQLRRLLATPVGKIGAVLITLGIVAFAVYTASAYFKGDTPDAAFYTTFIDPETGQSFKHKNEIGDSRPLISPFTGKKTAMPAEPCYWNKDGSVRKDPFWVLLNSEVGKPEPTFCPDCGRLVVAHNPQPQAGRRPPPTKEEWLALHSPSDN